MTKERFKEALIKRVSTEKEARYLAKIMEDVVSDWFYETEMEIWNAGCTHRMHSSRSDDGWSVCEYSDPLHPIKEYKQLSKALDYMRRTDEEGW